MLKNTFSVQPGIGDGDDLLVKLHESSNNKVYPEIRKGFYYKCGQEDYLYASEGSECVNVPSGSANIILATQPNLENAAVNGPIIFEGTSLNYTRVSSNMAVFHSLAPTASGSNLLFFNVPGELLFATDVLGNDMQTVSSTGSLTSRDFCYFDSINSLMWINRDPSDVDRSENLYITYLKDTPTLSQEEIILVDYDGNIRVMFDRVASGSQIPTITLPGIGNISVRGVCKNVITPGIPLDQNTRVGISYYVDGSFLIVEDINNQPYGTTITTYRSFQEQVTVRWEQAYCSDYFDTGVFSNSNSSFVQLNPLYSGIQSGFIYLDSPRLPEEKLSYITVRASPLLISGLKREPIRIAVTSYDVSNNPIPKVTVSCWITNSTGEVAYPIPMDIETSVNNKTDFNGKRYYMWQSTPQSYGVYTVYASAMSPTSGAIVESQSITVAQDLIYTNLINTAKVFMYLNPNINPNGLQDLYVYMTTQSGIPYIPDLNVSISCTLGLLFNSTNFESSGNISGVNSLILNFDTNNLSGLRTAVCQYKSVTSDIIVANPVSNYSDPSNIVNVGFSFSSSPLII